jgi:opacity protein-like surface antigen
VPAPAFITSRQNLNGWEIAGGVHVLPMLRLVGDVSGHYGPTLSGGTSNTHQHTFLFGPEVALPSRVSPFAHVLFGGSHQTEFSGAPPANPAGYNFVASSDRTGFAMAIGGGIDLKVFSHVWIRPIQFDYLATRLNGSTQNQPRVSAGIVLHF